MKKKKKNKFILIISLIVIAILLLIFFGFTYTGNVTNGYEGPTQEDVSCMQPCMLDYCTDLNDESCTSQYRDICLSQCDIAPKPTDETEEQSCTSECILQGCDEFDFICQQANLPECEKSCGLILEPEAKNEEEQCIRDCVNAIAPGTICSASAEGETGNEICQQCAAQCVYLYAGPCLGEEKLEEKKAACVTCEHCYGEPIMGDSGEGWECIVDVECKDATSEFGDEPGIEEAISNVFESISNFISNIFGNE